MEQTQTVEQKAPEENEEWRVISEAPEYSVSSFGRIRRDCPDGQGRNKGHILKPAINAWGYKRVNLYVNSRRISRSVHRIVCVAFHGPAPSKVHQVAHNNGISLDNAASNLRWATPKENMQDRNRHGTHFVSYGELSPNSILTKSDVVAIRHDFKIGNSIKDISKKYSVGKATIWKVANSKSWKHIKQEAA